MNKGMLTVGIILLSVIALLIINILTGYSTGSELDYYLVKETTNSAMVDAEDYVYLRECGVPRIDKEKFVESFLYRFADNVDGKRGYTVSFYDINEVPPKVSVKVNSTTSLNFELKTSDGETHDSSNNITTSYDAIIETTNTVDATMDSVKAGNSTSICNFS